MGLEKLGRDNPDLVRAMGAFGGGPARSGGVCGILSGAAALIGLLHGRSSPDQPEDPRMWELNFKLAERFAHLTAMHGGMDCQDIVGMDWRDEAALKFFRYDPSSPRHICVELVGEMAAYLGELLEQGGLPKT